MSRATGAVQAPFGSFSAMPTSSVHRRLRAVAGRPGQRRRRPRAGDLDPGRREPHRAASRARVIPSRPNFLTSARLHIRRTPNSGGDLAGVRSFTFICRRTSKSGGTPNGFRGFTDPAWAMATAPAGAAMSAATCPHRQRRATVSVPPNARSVSASGRRTRRRPPGGRPERGDRGRHCARGRRA